MGMIIYLILQSKRKRTIEKVDDVVLQNCAEFVEYILPIIKKFLKIESNPTIHFTDTFYNPTQYSVYNYKSNQIYISIDRIIGILQCYNYYTLLFNLACTLAHELTHYKQHIEKKYDFDNIIYIEPSFSNMNKYYRQPVEKEAFRQGYLFIKKNKKIIKEKIDKIVNQAC